VGPAPAFGSSDSGGGGAYGDDDDEDPFAYNFAAAEDDRRMHGDEEPAAKRDARGAAEVGGELSTVARGAGLDGKSPPAASVQLSAGRSLKELALAGTRKRGAYTFASADWKSALLKGGISVVAFAALAGACVALIFAVNDVQVRSD
jgi:hypothetical protein